MIRRQAYQFRRENARRSTGSAGVLRKSYVRPASFSFKDGYAFNELGLKVPGRRETSR
jgi:hypothetical protein